MSVAEQSTTSPKADQTQRMGLAAVVSSRVEIDQVMILAADLRRHATGNVGTCDITTSANVTSRLDEEKCRISVRIEFQLSATKDTTDLKKDEMFKIGATFMLIYKVSPIAGLEEKNVTAFGELNGMFNAWPYWREFVQSSAARMGLSPLVLPSLKLFDEKTTPKKIESESKPS